MVLTPRTGEQRIFLVLEEVSMNLEERCWKGGWISDPSYQFKSPGTPVPMIFRRRYVLEQRADIQIFATAMGIFDLLMDGQRLADDYFNPGFTDYRAHLQYIAYEPISLAAGVHELMVIVAGGWAVGRSTHVDNTNKSKSKLSAQRQALLCDLVIHYEDGSIETIGSDHTFDVSEGGPWRFADFYDGEVYDARISIESISWHRAALEELCVHPKLCLRYGLPVTGHETFSPISWQLSPSGEWIADFGQNLAGIVHLTVKGRSGVEIILRHAEALEHGELYVKNLRSAKQTIRYFCRDGIQSYSPRFTYMGFRYVGVRGISKEDIQLTVQAVYSDLKTIGNFCCSEDSLNRLQSNVMWSGKSNFVDIPTDCPQRDERQGWTGDMTIFVHTACFNFEMSAFLKKWLLDVKTEQSKMGAIPFVIPSRPGITPKITTSCWGDCCILVPWSLYMSEGDKAVLQQMYPTIKRYLADVRRWAALSLPIYRSPYILSLPFQFGDWCAPNGGVSDWLKRGPWVGTAYFAHSCQVAAKIACILGQTQDAKYYKKLSKKIKIAFRKVFTDGHGRMKNEFQSAYVLALAFGLEKKEFRPAMAARLWELIRENGCHLSTGFTATPYLLYSLCDNGYEDEAYRLLLQETKPSWLYQVKHGATTIWEQWDCIQDNGMIREASLNHYAYGSVGAFFYERICGLEPIEPGYRRYRVKPHPGRVLRWAACEHICPYGKIAVRWEKTENDFHLWVTVPQGTRCDAVLPDGTQETVDAGSYEYRCAI